ncbi:MAG: hypothetical protein K6T75_02545 [Acetobacteraceae bacterium]|nr:hypothetical protein [Acetobacteraceae bacterium]
MSPAVSASRIARGVSRLLAVNMGLRPGERVLVATDLPTPALQSTLGPAGLAGMERRNRLARAVCRCASGLFPRSRFDLLEFPATGRSGAEPDPAAAEALLGADVLLLITTFSLSHTRARAAATARGARVASMPGFEGFMLGPRGALAVDHRALARSSAAWAGLLTRAQEARVECPAGTRLTLSLAGREAGSDDGLFTRPGQWGNLPAGEAFVAPVEGSAEGTVVVEAGWAPEPMAGRLLLEVRGGEVGRIEGRGACADRLRALLLDPQAPPGRRNLAELGVGTNPNARRPDSLLEAEKIRGTVHVAVGGNAHMGGKVEADLHYDLVIASASLWLDGRPVMDRGRWRLP